MMVFFGVMGYLLRKFAFPASPFILAMILGPMLEKTLQQSLIGSGGEFHDLPRTGRFRRPC